MPANPDFKDLFSTFGDEAVEYLVAGAHAVIFHAEPRYTKDVDVWVNPTPENSRRVFRALKTFGAPLSDVEVGDFCNRELIYQVGVAPNRIDIIMGKKSLIKAKRASGRPQDLLDLERLE